MGPCQRALLPQGRLASFLEPSAVRDSAENAGNELRIIDQAEAEEGLILLTEVRVHAYIEGLAIFLQIGRSVVI